MLHRLDVSFDYDFLILGISCHEKDYRLAWFLNRELGFNLEKIEHLETPQRNSVSEHSLFRYQDREEHIDFDLLMNRAENGYLLPELANIDYLLKWPDYHEVDQAELIAKLRKIPIIIAALPISVSNLKSRDNLLY